MSISLETYALCKKYTNKKIEEMADQLRWKKVFCDELPLVGEDRTLYFLRIQDTSEENYYDEYIWLEEDERYEQVGTTKVVLVYDDHLDLESENAVQNKVVTAALNTKLEDAFSTVVADQTILQANGETTLGILPGNNVTIEGDTELNNVTISAVDTLYEGDKINIGSASNWNAGSLPQFGTTLQADKVSSWNAGTTPSFTIEGNHILCFDEGSVSSLSYDTVNIPNITNAGTLPSLTITPTEVLNDISEIDD